MIAGACLLEGSSKYHSLFGYLSILLTSQTCSNSFVCKCMFGVGGGEGGREGQRELEMERSGSKGGGNGCSDPAEVTVCTLDC